MKGLGSSSRVGTTAVESQAKVQAKAQARAIKAANTRDRIQAKARAKVIAADKVQDRAREKIRTKALSRAISDIKTKDRMRVKALARAVSSSKLRAREETKAQAKVVAATKLRAREETKAQAKVVAATKLRVREQAKVQSRAVAATKLRVREEARARTRSVTADRVRARETKRLARQAQKDSIATNVVAAGVTGGFAAAGIGILKGALSEAGRFEQTTIALETILGSASLAQAKLKELSEFAARTPFTLPGVENAARSLLAVGFTADELLPTLKAVGDVAAGIGRGEDGLRRLILNLGQVRTQGRLTGRELRDFAVLGVPLIEELAKIMGVAKDEILKLTQAGDISDKIVTQAFVNMSSAGGRFANLMDKQNRTLFGQFSNLRDALILLSRELGQKLLPIVKSVTSMFIKLATGVNEFVKGSGEMIAGALVGSTAFSALAASILTARIAMKLLGITFKKVLIGTGIGIFIIALGAAFGVLVSMIRENEESMKLVKEIMGNLVRIGKDLSVVFADMFASGKKSATTFFGSIIKHIIDLLDWFSLMTVDWALTWQLMEINAEMAWLKIKGFGISVFRAWNASLAAFGAAFSKLLSNLAKDPANIMKGVAEAYNKALANALGKDSPFKDELDELGKAADKVKAQQRAERDRRRAEEKPEEGKEEERAKKVGDAVAKSIDSVIGAGRFGFAALGQKLQDALLDQGKDALNIKRNDLLTSGNKIQDQLLKATKANFKNPGLGLLSGGGP